MEGFIKLHRKIIDWEYFDDPVVLKIWLYILNSANYEEKQWRGKTIPRGSFITSTLILADILKLSRQQIRRALTNLQDSQNITTQTTNRFTQINVTNWAFYQTNDYENNQQTNHQTTNKPTIKQPTNNHNVLNKEFKEEKNLKETILSDSKESLTTPISMRFKKPTMEEIKAYCVEKGYDLDYERFYNFYESKGWLVGKSPMKNWKAAIATWKKGDRTNGTTTSTTYNGHQIGVNL